MTLPFLILAALTIAGAVAAMSLRNLVHCVLALTLAFAGLAGIYLLLGAQFVGFAQVLVYIGAIAILTVFAILLTRGTEPSDFPDSPASWRLSSAIVVGVFAVIVWAIRGSSLSHRALTPQPQVSVKQIGEALMGKYVLPLEVIGLLLTAALIGAVIIAMYDRQAK
jgi:NADH-quinone oxidoreductase subunit J